MLSSLVRWSCQVMVLLGNRLELPNSISDFRKRGTVTRQLVVNRAGSRAERRGETMGWWYWTCDIKVQCCDL